MAHNNKLTGVLLSQVTVVVALMLAAAPGQVDAAANITCEQVTNWLTPCISYGVFGGTVAPECCQGIKDLNAAYYTKDDIRAACSCIQQGAAMIPGIDYDRINNIATLCGTSCPYKVYPSTDCSKVV